ncbi:hypothetical protein KP509_32G063600 [Ceratopteris richardii]|uniref:Uncharacterized protein n=1 Tax=Ceratopteris richardii TaxID=49495 RepID=A0A8T2QUD9_CERRI|nr:hypothetical protein KP509_32G063600 [Ceratopteris richardii]
MVRENSKQLWFDGRSAFRSLYACVCVCVCERERERERVAFLIGLQILRLLMGGLQCARHSRTQIHRARSRVPFFIEYPYNVQSNAAYNLCIMVAGRTYRNLIDGL